MEDRVDAEDPHAFSSSISWLATRLPRAVTLAMAGKTPIGDSVPHRLREPRNCLLQALLELDERPPIQPLHRSTDIRTAALRIIDHRRDMADACFGADDLGHQACDPATVSSTGLPRLIGPASDERAAQQAGDCIADIADRPGYGRSVTVHDWSANAWMMNVGTIRPSSGCIRGP